MFLYNSVILIILLIIKFNKDLFVIEYVVTKAQYSSNSVVILPF